MAQYLKLFLSSTSFFYNSMQPLPHVETFTIFIFQIYCCFLKLCIVKRIYIWSARLKFILWHLKYNNWTESKIKSLPLINVSKPIWYLNIICIILSHKFFIFALRGYYMLSIDIFRRNEVNEVNRYCLRLWTEFSAHRFLKISYRMINWSTDRFLFLSLLL